MAKAKIDRNALWEAIKEPLRLLLLALIPFIVAYFTELEYEWAGVTTLILRFIDKWLHEHAKAKAGEKVLLKGLSPF